MKLIWSFALALIIGYANPTEAQSLRSIQNININSIVVRQAGQLTKAHILLDNPSIKVHNNRRYFYYTRGEIQQIQGGYHGHLLHGEYCNFANKDQLQTQGWFKNGLKHGLWKEWNEAGDLIKETSWHKGKVSGPFTHFDQRKNQVVKGHNSNGRLNGRIKTYSNGELQTIDRYKNGELKSTKEAQSFWEQIKSITKPKEKSKKKGKKKDQDAKKTPKEKKEKKTKKEKNAPPPPSEGEQ